MWRVAVKSTGVLRAWAMAVLVVCGMSATQSLAAVSLRGNAYDIDITSEVLVGYDANTTGTLKVDSGSVFDRSLILLGYSGSGALRVETGGQVSSIYGYWGFRAGSAGTAIITGAGSKWTDSGQFYVGWSGRGTLRVEAGGQVSNTWGYLGTYSGSTGTAIVTGAGSTWANSAELYVGDNGSGALTVSDGGQVTARNLSINGQSAVRLHVSGDRMLVLGNAATVGGISNSGKLSLLADAFLPAGSYRPIGEYADRALRWSGNGSTLAVGGNWDGNAGTFTVSAPTLVDAGTAAEVVGGMRLLISDPDSGERAGVSFGALSSGGALRGFPLTESKRADLLAKLDSEEMILSGWDFVGQLAGDEALVSLEVGLGAPEVRLWHLSQDGWSRCTPEMMTYDANGIVSYTVDPASLNSGAYAITVPEPGGLGLLAFAAVTLLRRWGRRTWRRCGRA